VTGKGKGASVNRTARAAGVLYLLVFPFAALLLLSGADYLTAINTDRRIS
jgi:hypothetical protein